MNSTQAQIAMTATDADVAIEQLAFIQRITGDGQVEMLRKALEDAIQVIRKLRGEAIAELEKTAKPEDLVLYSYDNSAPTSVLQTCTARMRVGSIREIKRLVVAEPLFAVCVAGPNSGEWTNRFRIVDSEKAAQAVKVLHNV